MNIHALEHVPFEGLAGIGSWLASHGHSLCRTRFWAGDALPEVTSVDWLIVMGGPMGVHDEATNPWLKPEKRLIEQAILSERKVLGICLGSQLIAHVLGARVYPNRHKEIGWFPIDLTPDGDDSPWLHSVHPHPFFHWHGDTFDLPAGSLHLARSAACENQAFSMGKNVLALQFHPDATQESIRQLLANCAADLTTGPFIQSAEEILSHQQQHLPTLRQNLSGILDAFVSEVEAS